MRIAFVTKSGREISVVSSMTNPVPVPRVGDTVNVGPYSEFGRVLGVNWNMTQDNLGTITTHVIRVTVVLDIE